MPSSQTITAFYSFSPNTRARASEVQANFDNFRGHIIPVEPLTITSADITYDIGSDEHRWRYGYFKTIDFDRSTSTASATIEADVNTNTGEMVFKLNGVEKGRLNVGGFAFPTRLINFAGTATTYGGIATHAEISNTNFSVTAETLIGATLTLNTLGGVVAVGFAGSFPYINMGSATTTSGPGATLRLYRDTTTSQVASIGWQLGAILGQATNAWLIALTPQMMYDMSCPAGTHNYFLKATSNGTASSGNFNAYRLIARELT